MFLSGKRGEEDNNNNNETSTIISLRQWRQLNINLRQLLFIYNNSNNNNQQLPTESYGEADRSNEVR